MFIYAYYWYMISGWMGWMEWKGNFTPFAIIIDAVYGWDDVKRSAYIFYE